MMMMMVVVLVQRNEQASPSHESQTVYRTGYKSYRSSIVVVVVVAVHAENGERSLYTYLFMQYTDQPTAARIDSFDVGKSRLSLHGLG